MGLDNLQPRVKARLAPHPFFTSSAKTSPGSRRRSLQKGSPATTTNDPTKTPIHLTNSSQHPPLPLPNPNREPEPRSISSSPVVVAKHGEEPYPFSLVERTIRERLKRSCNCARSRLPPPEAPSPCTHPPYAHPNTKSQHRSDPKQQNSLYEAQPIP